MNLFPQTPHSWTKANVGQYCDVQLGKMLQNDPSSQKDELKPYLRAINIGKGGLDLSHDFSMWIRPQEAERFCLTKGDILVSEGGDAGRAATFDVDGEYYFQNALNRVRPNHHGKITPEFIYYWFTYLKVAGYVEMICNVATIPHFTAEKVKAAPLVVPPLATQRRIARFLDEKTARIDALIEKKRELLDRLAEKRQALITRAVTKGLNPDAPMKPSGIDWLGDIPAHWEVRPIYSFQKRITYGFTNPMPTTPEGPFMLTANDIGHGEIRYTTARKTDQDAFDNDITEKSRPKRGDVLITKDGTLGRVAVFDGRPACINQSVALLRTFPERVNPNFLSFCLLSEPHQKTMLLDAGGTTIKHIYITRLTKMPIAVPNIQEQREITGYCDAVFDSVSSTETKLLDSIQILNEYRTAVVTSAVTGHLEECR